MFSDSCIINHSNVDRMADTIREQLLHDALSELMEWISNWHPNFIYDEEWPETEKRVMKLLKSGD